MLYIRLDVPDEFAEIYNKFNSTKIGKKLLELSGIARKQLDAVSFTREYFSTDYVADMSVDPNANVGNSKNPSNYSSEISKPINKFSSYVLILEYLQKLGLDKKEAQSLVKRIILGDFYPHDQAKWNSPYCVATSTYNLMIEGRPYYQLHSLPPKRTDSFIKQATEFVMDLSNDFAGACALGDLIINYAYYLANEPNKTDKEIENDFQGFVHIVNNPFRDSNQSPFTNVSFFDEPTLRLVFKDYYYPNGKSPLEEPYFSLIKRVQKIFMEFMARKDPKTGMPYRFPIGTCNFFVERNEIVDKEFFKEVCRLNKEGVFNIYINDDGNARACSCCRLVSDITELMKFKGIDSFGNGGVQIGSTRIVTINLPRIALECKIKNLNLEKLLLERFDEACALVISHRLLIKDRIEQNFLKFFKPLHWLDLDRMFYSTIGLVGFYEFCEILGWDIVKTEGRNKLKKILKLLNDRLLENAQKYGVPMNMEQIPGESAAITLAKKDNVLFKTNYVMYSNQFVPLWHDILLTQRMEIDGELDEYFGGGVISHLNIGSKLTKDQVAEVIKYAIKCGLKHFALNPKFAVCKNKHITLSSGKSCPTCGAEIVDYVTRIVGYFVPVNQWVKERREWEFPKRKWQNL